MNVLVPGLCALASLAFLSVGKSGHAWLFLGISFLIWLLRASRTWLLKAGSAGSGRDSLTRGIQRLEVRGLLLKRMSDLETVIDESGALFRAIDGLKYGMPGAVPRKQAEISKLKKACSRHRAEAVIGLALRETDGILQELRKGRGGVSHLGGAREAVRLLDKAIQALPDIDTLFLETRRKEFIRYVRAIGSQRKEREGPDRTG